MSDCVPSGAFEEESIAETSIFGFLRHFVMLNLVVDLVLEGELINGDLALTGIVLECASEESLREEETTDPEGRWCSLVKPCLEEVDSVVQVNNPTGKRFQRKETDCAPFWWDLVIVQCSGYAIQFFTHDNFSKESALDIDKMLRHHNEQCVVSDQLLSQHSVH